MSTPYDPERPEDRPSDQPGYPPAPPPQQYPQGQPPQGGGYAGGPGGGQFPPAPDYGSGPQYGGAPQYGSAPQYSGPYGGAPQTPANPPKEVVWAIYAMYAAVALSLISLLITIADSAGYKETLREASPGRTADEIDDLYVGAVVLGVVLTLLISAVYVFLAINVRKGKSWARITAWVVLGIFTFLGLLGLAGDVPAFTRLLSILVLLANVAAIVLLAMRPANEYFAARKAPRY